MNLKPNIPKKKLYKKDTDMEKTEIYMRPRNPHSRLIYITGILWNTLNEDLEKTLAKVNLNNSKFNILMIIRFVGGEDGIQQNEISKQLLVTASNITKLLDKLEAEELITRNNKSGDRRVKIIKITEKGSGLIDEIWADYNKTVNALTPNMTDDELQFMIDKLVKWHNDIK